jgi:uncharacterized repeat protein (TIGR03803 family)
MILRAPTKPSQSLAALWRVCAWSRAVIWGACLTFGLFPLAQVALAEERESAQKFELLAADPTAMSPRTIMRASEGAFYGTARGGPAGKGTIYRMRPGGRVETLWSFRGADGESPLAGLVEGSDGFLYGTTHQGGIDQFGTVFRMSKDGQLTTLVSLNSAVGGFPSGRLIETPEGSFLGVAAGRGAYSNGTVFKVTTAGDVTVLADFTGLNGGSPRSGLVRGADGNYYGTTDEGGTGRGTIFRLTPEGTLTTLKSLHTADGIWPSELLLGRDGNFYGMTRYGGANDRGTLFKMSPDGDFTVLTSFANPRVPSFPSQLVQDSAGAIYGTLDRAIFKYTATGGVEIADDPRERIDYDYWSGLASDGKGGFVGTTTQGEGPGEGRIFAFRAPGDFQTLALFGEKGARIGESLARGDNGEIYATTEVGVNGYGSVVQLSPTGEVQTVHAFSGRDGSEPKGGLVRAKNGSFYGTTGRGGDHDCGTVFKFTPGIGVSTLYSFPNEGSNSTDAWLASAGNGDVYGVTHFGGAFGYGTVFRIEADDLVTRIAELNGSICRYPDAALVEAADGSFYGTAHKDYSERVTFRIVPDGQIAVVARSIKSSYNNASRMIRCADGAFYGCEYGSINPGRIFKLTPAGQITTVAVFSAETGTYPKAGMVEGPDGFLYGTASGGGAHGFGTVFRASREGEIVALHSFDGVSAAYPQTTPIVGTDGHIYGAADHFAFWRVNLNHAPSPEPDEVDTRAGRELFIDVLANDGDPDGDELTVKAFSQGEQGGFVSLVDGRIRYVARPSFVGPDMFHYTIGDGRTGTATGTVTVNVAPAQMLSLNAPVAGAGQENSAIPAGAVWSYFGSPAINELGTVAMFARWHTAIERSAGIVGIATSGDVAVYARIGDAVPGLPGTRFESFLDPLIATDRSVAFRASIAGAGVTPTTREVICWSDGGGRVEVVARAGDSVPFLRKAKISRFASLALAPGGEVLFRASLTKGDTVNETNDDVLFAWSELSGSTRTLIREGQSIVGLGRVGRFTTLVDSRFALGVDRGWFGRASDSEPWSARMRVDIVGTGPRLMEWQPRTGTVRVFATRTSGWEGTESGEPRAHDIVRFGLPGFSAVAGGAWFRGVTSGGRMTLYRQEDAGSSPNVVYSVQQSVPNWPRAQIVSIGDPVGAPNGSSATWLSRAREPARKGLESEVLLWAATNEIRTVAKSREQAAGCEPGAQWKRFTSFCIPRSGGGPVFLAQLRRGLTANNSINRLASRPEGKGLGMWVVDSAAEPRLFLRDGENIDGVAVTTFRAFGRGRGASGNGRGVAGDYAAIEIVDSRRNIHILPVALP